MFVYIYICSYISKGKTQKRANILTQMNDDIRTLWCYHQISSAATQMFTNDIRPASSSSIQYLELTGQQGRKLRAVHFRLNSVWGEGTEMMLWSSKTHFIATVLCTLFLRST